MERLVWLLALLVGWSSAVFAPGGAKAWGLKDKGLRAPEEQQRERVKTVRVNCHPNSLEIVVKADMFEIGAPVYSDELRLGVEQRDHCRAHASSEGGEEEYTILVGLADCGTKHWVSEDALIYTNLLIFSPRVTPDGLIRMDEAVIPIECQYERKYSLSSSSLTPTWVPFMATQAAVETLAFDLRLVTDDWLYDRRSHVFHLGDLIPVEASVHVGHHLGLRVFVNNCVATLSPDVLSQPRHVFIENGCFIDSQLPGSKSQFLPRTQDEKLRVLIDAFRFHNQEGGELYITCQLNAVPANDPEAPQKACTFVNGRWKSANSNDYLCASCQSHGKPGHGKPSAPGKFGPRGFQKPESKWRSGTLTKPVLEQEARMGPLVVLPAPRSPLPAQELPPVLSNILKPRLYGSQWRSGPRAEPKALVPDTPDLDQEETSEDASGEELKSEGSEGAEIPAVSGAPPAVGSGAADLGDVVQSSGPDGVTMTSQTIPERSDVLLK